MGDSDRIQVEKRDCIGIIRLNRPDKLNATTTAMLLSITEAMRAFEADDMCKAIVIHGAGTSFSAGRDLKEIGEFHGESISATREGMQPLLDLFGAFHESAKVTVSVVQGYAMGFGAAIAANTDLTIAERGAVFAMAEARRGLGTFGPLPALMQSLPYKILLEMVLTGLDLDAERAYQIGFVNRLVEPGSGLDTALELLGSFLDQDTGYIRDTKAAIKIAGSLTFGEAMEFLVERSVLHHLSGGATRGIATFVEKQPGRTGGSERV